MLFKCSACLVHEKNQGIWARQLADRDEQILKLMERNQELVDKILAVTSPAAVKVLQGPREPRAEPLGLSRPRPNFPGYARKTNLPPPPRIVQTQDASPDEELLDKVVSKLNG